METMETNISENKPIKLGTSERIYDEVFPDVWGNDVRVTMDPNKVVKLVSDYLPDSDRKFTLHLSTNLQEERQKTNRIYQENGMQENDKLRHLIDELNTWGRCSAFFDQKPQLTEAILHVDVNKALRMNPLLRLKPLPQFDTSNKEAMSQYLNKMVNTVFIHEATHLKQMYQLTDLNIPSSSNLKYSYMLVPMAATLLATTLLNVENYVYWNNPESVNAIYSTLSLSPESIHQALNWAAQAGLTGMAISTIPYLRNMFLNDKELESKAAERDWATMRAFEVEIN